MPDANTEIPTTPDPLELARKLAQARQLVEYARLREQHVTAVLQSLPEWRERDEVVARRQQLDLQAEILRKELAAVGAANWKPGDAKQLPYGTVTEGTAYEYDETAAIRWCLDNKRDAIKLDSRKFEKVGGELDWVSKTPVLSMRIKSDLSFLLLAEAGQLTHLE